MKPVVSAMNAWSCVVVSVFAIVILSVIGALFKVRYASSSRGAAASWQENLPYFRLVDGWDDEIVGHKHAA
jgi:hypothetical protein